MATPDLRAPGEDVWHEIIKLSRKKRVAGKVYYYVHWKDANGTKSWESADNITHSAIDAFENARKTRTGKRRKDQTQSTI